MQRIGVLSLCVVAGVWSLAPPMMRAWGANGGAGAAPAKAGRSADDIMKEMSAVDKELSEVMPSPQLLANPEFRADNQEKVVPLLKKAIAILEELQAAAKNDPKYKDVDEIQDEARTMRFRMMGYAAALGDKETRGQLETMAKGKGADALPATTALTLAQWLLATKDAAAQDKLLDGYAEVVKANPTNDDAAVTLAAMANLGAANEANAKKAMDILRTNSKSPEAKQILAEFDAMQEQKAMVGKPLVVEGRLTTGGAFSSADYKGKVVMVDFWATWCGPCIAELPNVKKVYGDFHPKGLEIVGVSCDVDDDSVNSFTAKNDMPWKQLRELTQNEEDRWNPLAKQWHVDGIPAMFLIDKKGILRYVDGREDLAKKVAALVAEDAGK